MTHQLGADGESVFQKGDTLYFIETKRISSLRQVSMSRGGREIRQGRAGWSRWMA